MQHIHPAACHHHIGHARRRPCLLALFMGIALIEALTGPAAAQSNAPQGWLDIPLFELYFPPHNPQVIRADALKKASESLVKILGESAAPLTLEKCRKLAAGMDYPMIKTLVEEGRIDSVRAKALGDLRLALALDAAAKTSGKMKRTIYVRADAMLNRGISSPARLTLFVYKDDGQGNMVRDTEGEKIVRGEFEKQFSEMNAGAAPGRLGIRVNETGARFPQAWEYAAAITPFSGQETDPGKRQSYKILLLEKQAELKKDKGVIFSQAQEHFAALDTARTVASQLGADRSPGMDMHPELKKRVAHSGDLLCLKLQPGPAGATPVPAAVSVQEAADVLIDRVKPTLLKGHAFDLAVSSFLRFNGDPQALLDPMRRPPVEELYKALEGLRLTATDATRPQSRYLPGGYRNNPAERVRLQNLLIEHLRNMGFTSELDARRLSQAMDISRKILDAGPKADAAFLERVFEPLARDLAGPQGDWKNQLVMAREVYNQNVQRILQAAVYGTLKTGLLAWLAQDSNDLNRTPAERLRQFVDEPLLRRAMGLADPAHDRVWNKAWSGIARNYAAAFELALVHGISTMQADPVFLRVLNHLINSASLNPVEKQRALDLIETARKTAPLPATSSAVRPAAADFGFWRRHYDFIVKDIPSRALSHLGAFLREYTLAQYGLQDVNLVLSNRSAIGLKGWDAFKFVLSEMRSRKWRITGKILLQAVPSPIRPPSEAPSPEDGKFKRVRQWIDWGGVDSLLSVAVAYSESGGNADAAQKKLIEECVENLPIVGQVFTVVTAGSLYQSGVRAGMIYACIKVPHAAVAALIWSITDKAMDLYYYESSRPFASEVADALYRGYVGPPPYDAQLMPPEFTKAEAQELDQVSRRVADALRKPNLPEAEYPKVWKDVVRRNELEYKRSRWAQYIESSRGRSHDVGAICQLLGWGVRTQLQKLDLAGNYELRGDPLALGGPLLARVPPILVFLDGVPSGFEDVGTIVDFELPPLTDGEREKLEKLRKERDQMPDFERQFDLTWEINELESRQARWELARNILEASETNVVLRHQIQRDSLWPYMLRDTSHLLLSPDRYVRDWITLHRKEIPPALYELGIGNGTDLPSATLRTMGAAFDSLYDRVSDTGMKRDYMDSLRPYIPEMSERLRVDTERSKRNWAVYEAIRQAIPEVARKEKEAARQTLLRGAVIEAARRPPSLLSPADLSLLRAAGYRGPARPPVSCLADAVEGRHLPAQPLRLDLDLRLVEKPAETPGGKPVKEIHADMEIAADPGTYRPPYFSALFQLDPDMATKALASGRHQGLPLSPAQRGALQLYLKEQKSRSAAPAAREASGGESVSPALLVFGFCSAYTPVPRLVPETAGGLPVPVACRLEGREGVAWLLGGAGCAPENVKEEMVIQTPEPRLMAEEGYSVRDLYVSVPLPAEPPPDRCEWKIFRSRAPDGPWICVAAKDKFPPQIGGPVEWRYLAVARPYALGRNRINVLDDDELTAAQPASIRLDLQLPKPEFVITPTNRWDEGFIRWKQPELAGLLDTMRDQIQVDAYFANAQEGPYVRYRYTYHRPSLLSDDCQDPPPEPRRPNSTFVHSGSPLFHGMSGYMKARLVLGELASDWVTVPLAQPPVQGEIQVGQGQTIWIRPTTNTLNYPSQEDYYYGQPISPASVITPFGASGINEQQFKQLTDQVRRNITAQFWNDNVESSAPRAELEKDLARELADWQEGFYEYRKARAPLPASPLGSVIGRFTPATVQSSTNPPWHYIGPCATNDQERVRLWLYDGSFYFPVGSGGSFDVPGDGVVTLLRNWDYDDNRLIVSNTWEVNCGYSKLSSRESGPPRLTGPVWSAPQVAGFSYQHATVKTSPLQAPREWLGFCTSASPAGPWEHGLLASQPEWSTDLRIGDPPVYVRAVAHLYAGFTNQNRGYFWLTGMTWSDPLKIERTERSEKVSAARPASIAGHRGQTVAVTVSGQWNPFRFATTKPYGPEGLSAEDFTAGVEKVKEISKGQSPVGGMLGVAMKSEPGAGRDPAGEYLYDEFALEQKGMFQCASLPAGALFAMAHVGGGTYGPLPVGRAWSFTFPENGFLVFYANTFDGWVGEKPYLGDMALTLSFAFEREERR